MSVLSSHRWLVESLQSLTGIRHRSLVCEGEPPAVDTTSLPSFLLGLVHGRAHELLASGKDRHTESLGEVQLIARRIGPVVVCLAVDPTASVADVERKLNVVAVRAKVQASYAPAPASLLRVKEAFVAAAGPFSERVFDRDWESHRQTLHSVTDAMVIQFARGLFPRLSPPKNHVYAATIERIRSELGVPEVVDARAATIPAPPTRTSTVVPKAAAAELDPRVAEISRLRGAVNV